MTIPRTCRRLPLGRNRRPTPILNHGAVFGLLILVSGLLFDGCVERAKPIPRIEIETFTPGELVYPEDIVSIQDGEREEFLKNFFAPWDQDVERLLSTLDSFPGKEMDYLEKYRTDSGWYGENKKPHDPTQREALVENSDIATFPNFLHKGIVFSHTDLRRIPSERPGFDTYGKAGEGFPFDYFQETNLWANTPLQLLHRTKDGQWCYVVSPYYKGWVPMKAIGLVDQHFRQEWKTGSYAMPVSDQIDLLDTDSFYALEAKMGMVLPFRPSKNPNTVKAFYVNSDADQTAVKLEAEVEKEHLAFDGYRFDADHLKVLISDLEGKPYGWGGNLQNRDCSSMIRDLMATFKVWLPRDSKDQIEVGALHELTGTNAEKIEKIKTHGIPFRTILRKKGHNMLYVGQAPNGEPLIFHAIWGLKTTYEDQELRAKLGQYPIEGLHSTEDGRLNGRHIIGKAVITSVNAGAGYPGITVPLIEEIYAMTTLLETTR